MIPLRKLKMCFTSAIKEAKRLEIFDIIQNNCCFNFYNGKFENIINASSNRLTFSFEMIYYVVCNKYEY